MSVAHAEGQCPHIGAVYNPFIAPQREDPYPILAQARKEEPVFYSEVLGMWIVTRYDDISLVLKDPIRFSSHGAVQNSAAMTSEVLASLQSIGLEVPNTISDDPPIHTRRRRLLSAAFTPRRVATMEPRIRTTANTLVDGFIDNGSADIVAQFAYLLPLKVVCQVLGVPDDGVQIVKQGSDHWAALMSGHIPAQEQSMYLQEVVTFNRYITDLIEQRRITPQDDELTTLVHARVDGEAALTTPELVNMVMGLLLAGHETTTNLISKTLLLLHLNDQWQALCADPSLAPHVIEEALRFDTPTPGLMRTTTNAESLGGVELPAGALLQLIFASANRDETHFADADHFDIQRDSSTQHLAFGRGIHFCIGSTLARLEGRVTLEVLSERLPRMRLCPEQHIEHIPNLIHRGLKSLWVEWDT